MRKIIACLMLVGLVCACETHDPILPGVRTAIFETNKINVLNKSIDDLPMDARVVDNASCKYSQDSSNVIWDGDRKIFSGFPTSNSVKSNQRPVCSGKYVYAGLTTGEVIKINPKNRQIVWIADVFRASNMTGGAPMVDIIAPIVPIDKYVYAAGLGDAFCKINASTGDKKWCLNIGSALPFVTAGNYAFIVSTDNVLYAVELPSGNIMWAYDGIEQETPEYKDKKVIVGDTVIDAQTGKKLE